MAKPLIFSTKANAEKRRKSLKNGNLYYSSKMTKPMMKQMFGVDKEGYIISRNARKHITKTKNGEVLGTTTGSRI